MDKISAEAGKIWRKAVIHTRGTLHQGDIELQSRLLKVFSVGDYYYYIFNVKESRFEFMSPQVTDVLGYQPDEYTLDFFLSVIHPEDQPWFLNFESSVVGFFAGLAPHQIPRYKARYDVRVRKSDGNYRRLLIQWLVIGFNEDGSVIKTLGIHTDISEVKKEGRPTFSLIGLDGEPSYIDIKVEEVFKPTPSVLSRREKEILDLLMEGKQSKEIAEKLFISRLTVDKHRNNILSKTGCANSAELISYAIRKGWV